jgi:hypothetical protein
LNDARADHVRRELEQHVEQLSAIEFGDNDLWAPGLRARAIYGPEAQVLKDGEPFQWVPWETWRGRGYRRAREKFCFNNANKLALNHDELTHVEGFAWNKGMMAVHHAWCVTEDGFVVDPTWRDTDETTEYLGIPFRDKAAMARLWTKGPNAALLDTIFLDRLRADRGAGQETTGGGGSGTRSRARSTG